MIHRCITQLEEKACNTASLCRVLGVSRSGYYAARLRAGQRPRICATSTHLRAAFDAPDWRTGVPVVCRTVEAFVRANDPAGQLLVWLLHAGPDPGARYDPMPSPGKSSGRRPELALGLQYLVAAQADDALRAQDILSRVLLRLHRRPRVSVASESAVSLRDMKAMLGRGRPG